MEKIMYIIAGCNGAGKTTASFTILPYVLDCCEFVNADEIAKDLSPFHPESVAIEAGRIMLNRIDVLMEREESFSFETTLAAKSYHLLIKKAKEKGFKVVLLFFWLRSIELAKARVATRVIEGGHNIPPDVIERRYKSGITNLFRLYLPMVDEWFLYDNSNIVTELIAEKTREKFVIIYNLEKWQQLNQVN
ncbi:zeta toxin [Aquirufa antheringensis]|nr:zeta toxin [Aquirufa antheringensis]